MKIKGANCPMGSGKTTQSMLKALSDLNIGNSTMIMVPSHAAADEIIEIARSAIPVHGYVVNLRGKSERVCLPEHVEKPCRRCPVFKAAFRDEGNSNDHPPADGEIFDVKRLWEVAIVNETCALVEARRLAMDRCPRVVVTSQAFLASKSTMDVIEKVNVDSIIVDEADVLFETLLGTNGRSFEIMRARQMKSQIIIGECNQICKTCVSHFADRGGKKIAPAGGRIEDLASVSNKVNTSELIIGAINVVERAVSDGLVHDLFDFAGIRLVVERMLGALPETDGRIAPVDYLLALEQNKAVNRIPLDEHNSDNADYVIAIDVVPVANDTYNEFSDECEFPSVTARIGTLRRRVLVNPQATEVKEIAQEIETFIAFVDFIHCAPGHIYLIPQKRRLGVKHGGAEHCALYARYVDTRHYRRVANYLSNRTKLLSGTLLSADLVAANLLVPSEEIDLKLIDVPFHKSALIIVHNPKRKSKCDKNSAKGLKAMKTPRWLPPWAVTRFYEFVYELNKKTRALHFAVNSREAGQFFRRQIGDSKIVNYYRIENRLKDKVEIDFKGSREDGDDERTALLVIDKLRSSGSRSLNRAGFQLCCVFGNGIANWWDRIPLFLEARKLQDDLTLSDFIIFEQTRAVTQALMRAPRSSEPTVCFYSGNLHLMAFPSFLRNRIVTTEELVNFYCREVGASITGAKAIDLQLRAITFAMSQFLETGELAIQRTRVNIADDILNRWDGRRPDAEERLKHIDACIADKGYLDRVKDRRGERPTWLAFLAWLVVERYLKVERRGTKRVFVKESK